MLASGSRIPRVGWLLAPLAVMLVSSMPARAQLGGSVPPESHEFAIEALYSGDFRRAERGFRGDLRSAIKIGLSRWVDSICSHAMLGETYFQQGRNAEAVAQFDQACALVVANADWMRRVKFQQQPRPDNSPARRLAPWGRSARRVIYATLPNTQLVSYGRINNTQQAETGGVVQAAQFWKVDVAEVMRCGALAIRRRNEMLGPLAPTDRLSRTVADTLAREALAGRQHWSRAWLNLQLGVAQMGVRKDQQAVGHLGQAIVLPGGFEHPMTGAALLAQAEIARRAGQRPLAASLYREAAIAAFAYEDLDVVSEALLRGYSNHAAAKEGASYAPLQNALAWARRRNFDYLEWRLTDAIAETMAASGQPDRAAELFGRSSPRQRDLARGRVGARRAMLTAWFAVLQKPAAGLGEAPKAASALTKAFGQQAAIALPNFQTRLANARFDAGGLSPRLAVDVYRELLADPDAAWSDDPFEAVTHLKTDHDAAFERWFAAAIARRETLRALEISDLAKRRRYLRREPLGGRLIALRQLASAKPEQLSKEQRRQQQAVVASARGRQAALQKYAAAAVQIAAIDPLVEEGRFTKDADRLFRVQTKAAAAASASLWRAALRRVPAPFVFPPVLPPEEAKERLEEGDALLVFHRSGGVLHGFLVVAGGEHYWRLPGKESDIAAAVGSYLRGIGNYNVSRQLSGEEAVGDQWREAVASISKVVLGGSRLDLAAVRRIIVVPDAALWHLPFEPLEIVGGEARGGVVGELAAPASDAASTTTLIDVAPIRYAPTYGLAMAPPRPASEIVRKGSASPKPTGTPLERELQVDKQRRLREVMGAVVAFPTPSPVASPVVAAAVNEIVVDLESTIVPGSPGAWSPLPSDRSADRGRIAAWAALAAAPERLVLARTHTAAESGLKLGKRRSASAGVVAGEELFHAACGLLAAGVDTALLTRWTTSGAAHDELIREFVVPAADQTADEAWRRAVLLVRGGEIDPASEPRLDWPKGADEPPPARHPFFWSGYLLIDAGVKPLPEEPDEEAKAAAPGDRPEAAPVNDAAAGAPM